MLCYILPRAFQASLCPSSNMFAQARVCSALGSDAHDKQIYSGTQPKSKARSAKGSERKQTNKWNDKCIFINHSYGKKRYKENMVIFHQSLPQLHKGGGFLFGK